jgi:stearoyl-CoA desaturase (delta-9 desaturase)
VSVVAVGEGWHNYHHVFPWDYKAAELGNYELNFAAAYIDFFGYIGWAYGFKRPSKELVRRVVQRLGDGSHTEWGHVKEVPEEDENWLIVKQNVRETLLESEENAKGK